VLNFKRTVIRATVLQDDTPYKKQLSLKSRD
jgi:hypothetical protein